MTDEQFANWIESSDYDKTFAEYRAKVLEKGPATFGDAVVDAWEKESWEDISKGGSGIPKALRELQDELNKAMGVPDD